MPTVTIDQSVTIEDTAEALQQKLGDRFEITSQGQGAQQALKVKQSVASLATVRLDHASDTTTTFHVHGGGLVISRMLNEFGIAKKVAHAIEEAFGTAPDPETASTDPEIASPNPENAATNPDDASPSPEDTSPN